MVHIKVYPTDDHRVSNWWCADGSGDDDDDDDLNGVGSDLHLLWEADEAGQGFAVETLRTSQVPKDLIIMMVGEDGDDDDDDILNSISLAVTSILPTSNFQLHT